MDVADLVIGDHRTSLAMGEILRSVTFPMTALRRRVARRRISLTPLGRSGALLIGTRDREGGFALTITASVPRPIRIATEGLPSAAELATLVETRVAGDWFDDIHGSPAWRRHVSLMFADDIRRELS
jgi:CO/xanthine dehydrogenase FAD-binding subunit